MIILLFVIVVSFVICEEDLPDPKDFVPVDDRTFDDGRKLCLRSFHRQVFTRIKTILGIGVSKCGSIRKGFRIRTLYFLIRNAMFPFFTVGKGSFSLEDMGRLGDLEQLAFLHQTSHMSMAVLGMFEYTKNGGGDGFRPIEDGDDLTRMYMFNAPAAERVVKYFDPVHVNVDIATGRAVHSFEINPDFSDWADEPRFSMRATMVDGPVDEPKRGDLSGMRMNPSSIKIGMNITNCLCREVASNGFGIVMLMITKNGTRGRAEKTETPDVDVPDEESGTNHVRDVSVEGNSAFMSFKKEVGRKVEGVMTKEGAFLRVVSYHALRKRIQAMTGDFDNFAFINDTGMARMRIKERSLSVAMLSVPRCDLDTFYWDPVMGFADYLDQEDDEDISSSVFASLALLMLVFLIL